MLNVRTQPHPTYVHVWFMMTTVSQERKSCCTLLIYHLSWLVKHVWISSNSTGILIHVATLGYFKSLPKPTHKRFCSELMVYTLVKSRFIILVTEQPWNMDPSLWNKLDKTKRVVEELLNREGKCIDLHHRMHQQQQGGWWNMMFNNCTYTFYLPNQQES